LASTVPAAGQDVVDPARLRSLETLQGCNAAPAGEVVVCGRRRSQDRYRLPQPGRPNNVGDAGPAGEMPRASTEVAASGSCGMFQGQRRCSRAEMAEAGYGEGRDPITFIGALVTRLV